MIELILVITNIIVAGGTACLWWRQGATVNKTESEVERIEGEING